MSKQRIHWKTHLVELIVVILGITIAFAIDEYAANRKEAAEIEVALRSIMDDLQSDVTNFERYQVPYNEEKLTQMEYILKQLAEENLGDDSLHNYIRSMFGSFNGIVTIASYESLKSSGKLEDIPNVEMRRRIINHYENNHAQSRYLTNYHTEFSTKLSDYVSSISSAFFPYDFNDPKLLKDPGFRSMTARWFQMTTFSTVLESWSTISSSMAEKSTKSR